MRSDGKGRNETGAAFDDASALATTPTDAGQCPPSTVRLDGQSLKMVSAKAYGFAGLPRTYVLVLSTRAFSCPELLSGGRTVTNDEWYVDVGAGSDPGIQQFVDADNVHAKVRTELVTAPEKAGDPIAICVREPARLAVTMRKTGSLEAGGLLRGTYCGEVK